MSLPHAGSAVRMIIDKLNAPLLLPPVSVSLPPTVVSDMKVASPKRPLKTEPLPLLLPPVSLSSPPFGGVEHGTARVAKALGCVLCAALPNHQAEKLISLEKFPLL